MLSWELLGTADIPNDGGKLQLTRRGDEYSINMKGARGELMNSRAHSSEDALAELGCQQIEKTTSATILIGGLGMGFTLAAALGSVSKDSKIIVSELLPEIVEWNRGALGQCAGMPLSDKRTQVVIGDVADWFRQPEQKFHAILLDVDNGPEAFTQDDNQQLYSEESLKLIRSTLLSGGMLAIWSAYHDPRFTTRLKKAKFEVTTKMVRAHKGKGSKHTIYLARKAK